MSVDLQASCANLLALTASSAEESSALPNLVIRLAPQIASSIHILYEKIDTEHIIFRIFFGYAEIWFEIQKLSVEGGAMRWRPAPVSNFCSKAELPSTHWHAGRFKPCFGCHNLLVCAYASVTRMGRGIHKPRRDRLIVILLQLGGGYP